LSKRVSAWPTSFSRKFGVEKLIEATQATSSPSAALEIAFTGDVISTPDVWSALPLFVKN
jgi:hypothetical protein